MKTILVTGSNGLLGQKITENILQTQRFNLIATSKGGNRFPIKDGYTYAEMDIINSEQVQAVLAQYRPDAVIHTAAMTNVDTCHVNREQAYQLNVEAVETLASLCEKNNIQLVQLSTDFVFDGSGGPYTEEAKPNPVSFYGETKLQAEEVIRKSKGKWVVLRTILVYGIVQDMSRSNIVLWTKEALEKREIINVVNDQWRTPTLAEDLAECCLLAVEKEAQGIYNASGKDMMTIVDLVRKVADFYQLDKNLIKEMSSASLNQEAKRPMRTGFILDKVIRDLGYQPHSFDEGLVILDKQMKR